MAGTRRAARGRAALASSGVHDEHRSRHPLLVMHRQGFGPRSRHQNLRFTPCNILHNTTIQLTQITTTLGKSYSLIITKRTNNEGSFNHNIIETPPPPFFFFFFFFFSIFFFFYEEDDFDDVLLPLCLLYIYSYLFYCFMSENSSLELMFMFIR